MVNIEELKAAIVDREEEIKKKFKEENIIERESEKIVKKYISTDIALIITGVRRCGKSILAFMLGKDNKYGYVNFEDERLNIEARDLNKVLEALYSLKGDIDILIFDEIQNIFGWERFITRLIQNKKIIITGSNARLLSKELATYLTGRHIDFTLYPFSFKEFLRFKNFSPNIHLTTDIAKIKNYLDEYLKAGGFPLTYKVGKLFLVENYKDIVERDVIQRYKIKYPKVLKDLAKYLISNLSKEISYNKLKNILGVKSVHTIMNYTEYIQNSYLVFLVERFSFKLKEQMIAPKKVYCIDTGLSNAIGFKFIENFGRLIENIVAIELKRREKEIYYWKDYQQHEVDFVIKEGTKVKQLIQVCYSLEDLETKKREIRGLIKASDELKCRNLLIITWDEEKEIKEKNKLIKVVPLWKWLLS